MGEELYIRHAPAGSKRGALFLILSHAEIPGTSDRTRVGLVRGVQMHETSLEVAELCRIPSGERGALVAGGLLAMPLGEDKRARVGKCLATYDLAPSGWDASRVSVDLRLDLGSGDGVEEGDRYEIQGEPFVDRANQSVTGYEPLGECTVQGPVGDGYAICRLDKKQWGAFTRDQALLGRFAVFRTQGR
ncbi:hypothetical protein [Nannocystis pusilla]|uniref:hypothetical protein n=1 Tax=Nannocystis pusilla TaxID=889268 RepID=UPI003DA4510C